MFTSNAYLLLLILELQLLVVLIQLYRELRRPDDWM
jgi:hypothetical protein